MKQPISHDPQVTSQTSRHFTNIDQLVSDLLMYGITFFLQIKFTFSLHDLPVLMLRNVRMRDNKKQPSIAIFHGFYAAIEMNSL